MPYLRSQAFLSTRKASRESWEGRVALAGSWLVVIPTGPVQWNPSGGNSKAIEQLLSFDIQYSLLVVRYTLRTLSRGGFQRNTQYRTLDTQ